MGYLTCGDEVGDLAYEGSRLPIACRGVYCKLACTGEDDIQLSVVWPSSVWRCTILSMTSCMRKLRFLFGLTYEVGIGGRYELRRGVVGYEATKGQCLCGVQP